MESFYNVKSVCPKNHGWLVANLTKKAMDRLWSYASIADWDVTKNLAGNISCSRQLQDKDDWFFTEMLKPLIDKYENDFEPPAKLQMTKNHPLVLDRFWINYQREMEFNPLHDHSGVYSFVIWMKIPTYSEEQHKSFVSGRSNTPKASDFDFTYIDILGTIRQHTYLMNPEKEGTMLFFPASLNHQVYPFYNSDKERVSISGNLSLDSSIVMNLK
jgi:hypothetical protein